jgi:murein DD-endopeptidase MepM/ murein hydrolase activator NlpD
MSASVGVNSTDSCSQLLNLIDRSGACLIDGGLTSLGDRMRAGLISKLSATALLLVFSLGAAPVRGETSFFERIMVVGRGDTIAGMLSGAGVDDTVIHGVVSALAPIFPPRSLRQGQEIAVTLDPARDNALVAMEVDAGRGRTVRARLLNERWQAEEVLAPQKRMLAVATGEVDGGLFPAAVQAGLPPGLALSVVRMMGHQVDFQRDLQPGDRFAILFERFRDPDGGLLGHGRVLHVELELSGKRLAFWRHETRGGGADWFDENGHSIRRSFLRTPLDGARISSRFGMRSHPILGFNRMHAGIDFAAPTGTPVYAAANGTVISARSEGAYGRIVRLRHANATETRYAHLSRFARGVGPRRSVKQGDVIGYVGSTGLSTGPHLHYEVVVSGRAVDPGRHVMAPVRLAGRDLVGFQNARAKLAQLAGRIGPRAEIAMVE